MNEHRLHPARHRGCWDLLRRLEARATPGEWDALIHLDCASLLTHPLTRRVRDAGFAKERMATHEDAMRILRILEEMLAYSKHCLSILNARDRRSPGTESSSK